MSRVLAHAICRSFEVLITLGVLTVGFASGSWGQPSVPHMATYNYSVVGVMPGSYDRSFKTAAHDADGPQSNKNEQGGEGATKMQLLCSTRP